MRVPQPKGTSGSLMWMQQGANEHATILNDLIPSGRERKAQIEWKSPLFGDDYAEYRDRDFLSKLGRDQLRSELEKFWPSRGPQWDALAVCDDTLLLIEAKAHIGELFSTEMQAGEISAPKIEAAMAETAAYIHANHRALTLFHHLARGSRIYIPSLPARHELVGILSARTMAGRSRGRKEGRM